jgi:hypothetical protein
MKIGLRRTIAILGGLAFSIVALFWSHIGAEYALKIFQHVHDVASVIGPDAMYKSFGDVYVLYAKYGLCLATGLSFAMMMWDRRPPAKRVTAVFWIFLALALPLTLLNYEQGDIFVSRMKQALVDVVIVFLSAVCALNLAAIKPTRYRPACCRSLRCSSSHSRAFSFPLFSRSSGGSTGNALYRLPTAVPLSQDGSRLPPLSEAWRCPFFSSVERSQPKCHSRASSLDSPRCVSGVFERRVN